MWISLGFPLLALSLNKVWASTKGVGGNLPQQKGNERISLMKTNGSVTCKDNIAKENLISLLPRSFFSCRNYTGSNENTSYRMIVTWYPPRKKKLTEKIKNENNHLSHCNPTITICMWSMGGCYSYRIHRLPWFPTHWFLLQVFVVAAFSLIL